MSDIKAEMTATPELDAKLRHLVPPQVRQDVQQLKEKLNTILQ